MTPEYMLQRLRAGDAAGALAMLDVAAPPDALDAASLVARGMVQLANHLPTEALSSLRMAVARGDTMPPTLLNLAMAEQQAGDAARATRLMESLAQRLPDWDEPPLRQAEALRASGEFEAAEQAYRRVLEINPRREAALLGLGALLLMRDDGEAARELLLCCCGIAPGRADAWDTLGLALLRTGDKKPAEAAFARAQELAPEVLEYGLHRADAAAAAGTEDSLLAWLEGAGDADPLNPVSPTVRGVVLERLGRRTEAIDALETATTLAPDALLPLNFLGELLGRSNRLREAEAVLRHALELDPDSQRLANSRAATLFRMYRHAEARTELLASLDRNGEQVNELCNLANATVCLGLQDEGVDAHRAIALSPDLQCRGVRCATRCPIATASPVRSCWRRCKIAPTGCRASRRQRSPMRRSQIGR